MSGETRERAGRRALAALAAAAMCLPILFSAGCTTVNEAMLRREQEILAEPVGDYYIGRRYFTKGTRFWGYVRRPREPWEESKLVVMNERLKHQPDRVPEEPVEGPAHGFDHNYEYRLRGRFSGEQVYDPNSNFFLPEFVLEDWTLIDEDPGYLFHPDEVYDVRRLPFRQ